MQFFEQVKQTEKTVCYHCGDYCKSDDICIDDKVFCCLGCKAVYELLNQNNLCSYYDIEKSPGISQKSAEINKLNRFAYLDDENIISKLLKYKDSSVAVVQFFIPQIHCSSCIWLLEKLYKLNSGIIFSEVNFPKKTVTIKYNYNIISLRSVVELLSSIGYEPKLNLDDIEKKSAYSYRKSLYFKIGVAGFCFGNVMLFSFPEYLSPNGALDENLKRLFAFINLILGTPVIFYSAIDYFKSAYNGIKQKTINIDFPIVLGLLVLYFRSAFEIITNTGAGFIDSLTGLIFFLLLGKIFQSKTFDALNFERNYKSYFPLSVTIRNKNSKKSVNSEKTIPVTNLKIGDRIIIRSNELIPADSILFSGEANIDYSFVTGESIPVPKVAGEIIYAGGKQIGSAIELEVIRDVSQSYLTQLWNNESFIKKDEDKFNSLVNVVGKYFTIAILLIASAAFLYWYPESLRTAINAFTAVLIIACPCGIALTSPFALGNALRIFARNKFFAKNASVAERISKTDTIVFDKTGTITKPSDAAIAFHGELLSDYEQKLIKAAARNSFHPLSNKIYNSIIAEDTLIVNSFKEFTGKGIEAVIEGNVIKLGNAIFAAAKKDLFSTETSKPYFHNSIVFVSINSSIKGYFSVNNVYREGFNVIIDDLKKSYDLHLLSGDSSAEKNNLLNYFSPEENILFNQSPIEKLEYIKYLQNQNKNVLMIGDGLNDAGAMKQSDVAIAVTEDISSFSPSCDLIMDASSFPILNKIIKFARSVKKVIIASFIISIIYNLIGISLAFQAEISPLMAAILMPASSVTVVVFTVFTTNFFAKKNGL